MPIVLTAHRESITIPAELVTLLREQLRKTEGIMGEAPLSVIFRFLAAKEVGLSRDEIGAYVYPKQGPRPKNKEAETD